MNYSPTGDLLCECGEPLSGGISVRGDNIVSCPKCQKSWEAGSYRHNPAQERQSWPIPANTLRYTWQYPNWIVKNGSKQEEPNGH